jgi:ferredoxin
MNEPSSRPRAANIFFSFLKKSRQTGWRGFAWRWLERIGPATRSSPLRRAIQIVCLAMFLYAFFYVCWPYATTFTAETFRNKESFPVELFLLIDPLVGLSTLLAGKVVNGETLWWMVGILAFCVIIPRAFCGYFCPLGTLIDAFDWLIGRHFKRFHLTENGPKRGCVHLKYYLLGGVLVTSLFGVLTSGFVSAIPILTRGLLFTGGRAQLGAIKGPNHLSTVGVMFYVSIGLFAIVFLLSLLGRRFWCRYVCPSGELLSVFNFVRVGERKVESTCINCNKCVEICPFDAIHEDFTTRTNDCTYCQTCGGVCPTDAIKFESLWTPVAHPEHAGCHQDCNFCTQVCPTGAIQPLDLIVKRETHMGLAVVNTQTCLPFREEGREDCNLCYVECEQAGYHAIEMRPISLEVDRVELEEQGFSDFAID